MKAPKQERCFALLIMVIIAISTVMMTMPVTAADGDVTFDLTTYFSSTSGIIPGAAPGGYVIVDVWVDTGTLTAATGMHGYGLKVFVNPTVLTPVAAEGGSAGYFLYEWFLATYPPGPGFPPTFISSVGSDYIECAEYFLPLPPTGATGTGKLCTLYFMSNSKTDYTELEIDVAGTGYQDPSGAIYKVYGINGHYNMPVSGYLFEQYSGSTWPPGDPIATDWHELEPVFCQGWTLESWIDNGDGKFSPSDQIDMFRIEPPQSGPHPTWFHVEWVSPAPVAGDGLPDMMVTEKLPTPEFPLGAEAALGMGFMVVVAYVWLRNRRKNQAN